MKPVDTRMALLALAVGGFAIGTTEFAAMSLLPQFARGLGIDEPTAGHVISAYALGVVVGAPTIAVLAAKIERRVLLIGSGRWSRRRWSRMRSGRGRCRG
jgi:DHA1 family inner membrane transport protein